MSEEEKQQAIARGRLGWSLRRIEQATGVRHETAGAYLKAAGVAVRQPLCRRSPDPASPVSTDIEAERIGCDAAITTRMPSRAPSASACEPYRELIELGLQRGRNAMPIWQDLATDHGLRNTGRSVVAVNVQRTAEAVTTD